MTSQPDKLFRDKLENFQRPAPIGAWDKIDSNLSRPDKKVIWIRIAAGIVLLTTAAILVWPSAEEKERIAVKQDQTPVHKKDPVLQQPVPVQQAEQEVNKSGLAKTERVTPKKQKSLTPVAPEKSQSVEKPVAIPMPEQQEFVAEVKVSEEKETAATTIVYSTAEVNSKFLKKKSAPHATPQAEDASHIQKLIGLAYSAKNSDTGLGDLRQKKDDILALSFGKKKSEN